MESIDDDVDEWQVLLEQAESEILKEKSSLISNDDAVYELAKQLNSTKTMDIDQFREYGSKAADSLKKYFNSISFITPHNEDCVIDSEDFLRYQMNEHIFYFSLFIPSSIHCILFYCRFIQRSLDVELTILKLTPYAHEYKNGYLVEKELEKYIFELIPDIAGCRNLPESFYPFYVFTASRRFFFYLDSKHNYRKLSIDLLAHSTIMEEFLFFKRLSEFELTQKEQQNQILNDENKTPIVTETSATNWFSSENVTNVYTSYINLDKDQNGMLSQRELIGLNSTVVGLTPSPLQLTSVAINRLFEEYITYYPKEMDYKTFLDLILALENKPSRRKLSLSFLFIIIYFVVYAFMHAVYSILCSFFIVCSNMHAFNIIF